MSRGRVRTRLLATMASVTALVTYGLVVAAPASAVPTCNVTGGVINVTSDAPGLLEIQVRNASGQIFVNLGGGFDAVNTCPGTPSIALLSTTTAVNVTADGGNQQLNLWLSDTTPKKISWGTINFTFNLGGDTAAPRDVLFINQAGTAQSDKIDLVMGANGIDLTDDGDVDVTVAGVENFAVASASDGEDSISAAGNTATGGVFTLPILGIDGVSGGPPGITAGDALNPASTFPYNWLEGGSGNDEIVGGIGYDDITGGNGSDVIDCGAGGGTVDYYDATTPVNVNLAGNIASGWGVDTIAATCADVQGSPQGDTITGRAGEANWIAPGPGDDTASGGTGGVGFEDTVSYWDAESAVTVDLAVTTAQDTGGSGSDTLSGFENAEGSDFDDHLMGTSGSNYLFGDAGNDHLTGRGGNDEIEGENGVDVVDYSWVTSSRPVSVAFSCTAAAGTGTVTGETADTIFTVENAILTANDDSFAGNQFQNKVWPNGGQNTLSGHGGVGCTLGGDTGGDTLDYSNGPYDETGVEVNMAGGATAGDSATFFEAAIGSAGKDNFTGNEVSNTLKGRAGNDVFRGGSGDDDIVGAKGNDLMRGGSGDDNLSGGKGKKDKAWGGSGDDVCSGVKPKYQDSCEG